MIRIVVLQEMFQVLHNDIRVVISFEKPVIISGVFLVQHQKSLAGFGPQSPPRWHSQFYHLVGVENVGIVSASLSHVYFFEKKSACLT